MEVYVFEQCLGGYFQRCQFTFPLSFLARLAMRHTRTFAFLRVFARLQIRHTRDFGVVILNYAYWTF